MKQKVSTNEGKRLEQVFDIKWGNKGSYYMSRKKMIKVISKPALLVGSKSHFSLLKPFSSLGLLPSMQNLGTRATQLTPHTGGVKVLHSRSG